jgi:two-component system KDP operon response regulator KdpE
VTDDRPHILIIDDEKQTSRTMAMALEAVGYATQEASTAQEGLKAALETHPQLIILDYHIGSENGISVLKDLRQDEWGSSASVIIASNVYDVDIINDIMSLGVQDYVLKADINLDDIVKLVSAYAPLPAKPE